MYVSKATELAVAARKNWQSSTSSSSEANRCSEKRRSRASTQQGRPASKNLPREGGGGEASGPPSFLELCRDRERKRRVERSISTERLRGCEDNGMVKIYRSAHWIARERLGLAAVQYRFSIHLIDISEPSACNPRAVDAEAHVPISARRSIFSILN